MLLAAPLVLNSIFSYLVPYLSYRSGSTDVMDDLTLSRPGDDIPLGAGAEHAGRLPRLAGALVLVLARHGVRSRTGGERSRPSSPRAVARCSGRRPLLCLAVAVAVGVVVLFAVSALVVNRACRSEPVVAGDR